MTCQAQWAVAARVVLPVDHDEDVLPLYVEYGRRYAGIDDRHDKRIRGWGEYKGTEAPAIGNAEGHSDDVLSRSSMACLLYTSDAADERSSVDLGGRRIIKKKKPDDSVCVSPHALTPSVDTKFLVRATA